MMRTFFPVVLLGALAGLLPSVSTGGLVHKALSVEMTEEPITPWEKRKEAINIIPTPKRMKISDGVFPLSEGSKVSALIVVGSEAHRKSRLGAAEIQERFKALSQLALPVKSDREVSHQERDRFNLILVGSPQENELSREYCRRLNIQVTADEPGPQGYVIRFGTGAKGKRLVILSGSDAQGTLYACLTFRYLMQKGDRRTYAVEADIKDWPDFKYRFSGEDFILPFRTSLWPALEPGDTEPDMARGKQMAKDLLDFCLRHKINGIDIEAGSPPGTGDLYYDEASRRWMKEMNDYAIERGILPFHCFAGNLGYHGKGKFKGKDLSEEEARVFEGLGCVKSEDEWGIHYTCWSRDDLMRRRFERIAQLVKETDIKIACFHFPDWTNEKWEERCAQCRQRFGKDRAAAQANVINLFYEAIKKASPDAKVAIVPRPYGALDLDAEHNRGIRERFEKLTQLIPRDVYIVHTMGTREAIDSWKRVFRQPLFHWVNMGFHWSLYFEPQVRLARTYHYADSDDIYFPSGSPNPVQSLGNVEYAWNANAPGGGMLQQDRKNPIVVTAPGYNNEDYDSMEERVRLEKVRSSVTRYPMVVEGKRFSDWRHQWQNAEVANFIVRACREVYGDEVGPYMSKVFLSDYNPHYLENPGAYKKPQEVGVSQFVSMYGSEVMHEQYIGAKAAAEALDEIGKRKLKFKRGAFAVVSERLITYPDFLKEFHRAEVVALVRWHLIRSEELIEAKDLIQAQAHLDKGYQALEAGEKELRVFWQQMHEDAQLRPAFPEKWLADTLKGLEVMRKQADSMKVRIEQIK